MEEDESMDTGHVVRIKGDVDAEPETTEENFPHLWKRQSTIRLLSEFIRLCPQVGKTIRNMNTLHIMIAKILRKEHMSKITHTQVANKMKSLRRKYMKSLERGKKCLEFGPALETAMLLMDQFNGVKQCKLLEGQAAKNARQTDEVDYSVEIVDESYQDQSDVMDMEQFLLKKNESAPKTARISQDPLEDVILVDAKTRESETEKLHLLGKKIENQEKSLGEKLRKNELIEQRNKLIANLLTKKTKNDVVDAIRKDRAVYHQNMKELWAERLVIEQEKLAEKKRKNDLLEERNTLMKALIEQMKNRSGEGISQSEVILHTEEIE